MAPDATNKDDDDYKKQSSSNGGRTSVGTAQPERKTTAARLRRERGRNPDGGFARVRAAYENATGNLWNKSDSAAFQEYGLNRIPVDKIISVLETVTRRIPTKINSFQLLSQRDPGGPRSAQPGLAQEAVGKDRDSHSGQFRRPRRLLQHRFPRGRKMRLRPRSRPV